MSTFKVGDTVRRTVHSHGEALVGECYTVSAVNGTSLDLEGHERTEASLYNYSATYFKLVQAASEQPTVLTPLEVFQCILDGVPLEYRYKSSEQVTWYTLNNPMYTNVANMESAEFRKQAQTVLINGISVPAPAKAFTEEGYGVNLLRNEVFKLGTNLQYAGVSWSTEAEACEALDAIMTSFSK